MDRPVVVSFPLAILATMAMMVAVAGEVYAAPQPPVISMSKVETQGNATPIPGGCIGYRVEFNLKQAAQGVVVQENFLNGLQYVAGSALLDGSASDLEVVQTASNPGRQVVELRLGAPSGPSGGRVLGPGGHVITLHALVPSKAQAGSSVVNSLNLYVAGAWKAKAEARTKIVAASTQRVSVSSSGAQGSSYSSNPSISANGRFVAFESNADNLVANDTNGAHDIFVHDRQTGTTQRASVASNGAQGNGLSSRASISADGRFVAFESDASNLVENDTNGAHDIFVHDRQTRTTRRLSLASDGAQGNSHSAYPSLSADGHFVAFYSFASNLVANDSNDMMDVFVHDRQTGTTQRASVSSTGAQGSSYSSNPSLSADGRFVAFESYASNLVVNDTNSTHDIFVHDRQTGTTQRVSVTSGGAQGNGYSSNPSISANGRFVAFMSTSTNLVANDGNGKRDVFVHDRQKGTTQRVSVASNGTQGNDRSGYPSISGDGHFVAFESYASNLVTSDTNDRTDVFVHDRQTGTTQRVSVESGGAQGNGSSGSPFLSADGRFVAFSSSASNLVGCDTNGVGDVFVRARVAP